MKTALSISALLLAMSQQHLVWLKEAPTVSLSRPSLRKAAKLRGLSLAIKGDAKFWEPGRPSRPVENRASWGMRPSTLPGI
jgi:hypothetical protein